MKLEDFRQLSAGHALKALSSEDDIAFITAIAEHPEWQYIADEDALSATKLATSAPELAPPPQLREQILQNIALSPQLPAATTPPPPPVRGRRLRRAGLFALAASVLVATAVTFGPQLYKGLTPSDPAVIALQQVEKATDAASSAVRLDDGASVTLNWSNREGKAVLVTEQMPTLPTDQDFELWILHDGEPVSAGVMKPEHTRDVTLLANNFRPGDTFAITIETAGGSPTGDPTSAPIIAIPMT